MKQKRIAIVGDTFTDVYCTGTVDRISPEAPVPVLDAGRWFTKAGGAAYVASILQSLRIDPVLFTITDLQFPFEVRTPKFCTPLKKTRYVCDGHQLLRVDEPKRYLETDLSRMEFPDKKDFDIIAFIDYNKGIIRGGSADFVDTKKENLEVFTDCNILKTNWKEFTASYNRQGFKNFYITRGAEGIDYYRENVKITDSSVAKEVIDVTGAGDVVSAVIISCLANEITDPKLIMKWANKAASLAVSRLGNYIPTYAELFKD